jgi:hypothetical protein
MRILVMVHSNYAEDIEPPAGCIKEFIVLSVNNTYLTKQGLNLMNLVLIHCIPSLRTLIMFVNQQGIEQSYRASPNGNLIL